MARNCVLSAKMAKDIDGRVERVLRGVGRPEPPLRLEDVRGLLKLDRELCGADDPGVLRKAVSRVRIAGIPVYKWPTLLIDAIRKASLQALHLPDRRRILLDESLPELKHRWGNILDRCTTSCRCQHELGPPEAPRFRACGQPGAGVRDAQRDRPPLFGADTVGPGTYRWLKRSPYRLRV